MKGSRFTIGFLVLAFAVLAPQTTMAQSHANYGQLFGTVTDPNGAVMPGTTVEAKNSETGLTRRAVSDASGFYRLTQLPVGSYDLKGTLTGFKTQIYSEINVGLGSSVRIDFALAISAIEEEIVVTAESPVVETTNASVSANVGAREIANLPLNGRDFTDFVVLTPGAIASTDEAASGRGGINIAARGIQNSFNIDGSNNQSSFFGEERGGTRPPFTFSQSAIKEMQVIRNSYNLQFSAGGGVINAITKSGTNNFHGEVFGYYRDQGMTSTNARGDEVDDFKQMQYGFSMGGPIVRDKVHWFAGVDAQDRQDPSFRLFYGLDDPDDIAEWEAITGLDHNTEVGDIGQTNDAMVFMVKLDWQINNNNLLTIRDNFSTQEGENLTNDFSTTGWSGNGLEENSFNSFVATLNSVISDSVFNEVYFQYAMEERPRTANYTAIPETQIGWGYDADFGQNQFLPNWLDETRFQIIDNLTFYAGKHTLKAGVNLDFVNFDDGFFRYGAGYYRFGNGWDDFFDGTPDRYRQSFSDYNGQVVFDNNYYAFYLQDEWRAAPNFTLTYGLRYQLNKHTQPYETNPLYPLTGQIPDDTNNWAPRVGFAWDVNGDGRSVLRGGGGIFYDYTPTLLDANALLANGIRVNTVTVYCSSGDCPTYPNTIPSIGDLDSAVSDIFVFDPNFEEPETLRFSLGYEREIVRDFSLGVDVIWSETKKLQRKWDQNIARDGGTTPDGRPTYTWGDNYEDLGKIMQYFSDARSEHRSVVLTFRKRFSHNWMLDGSYTWSDTKDNDSNERSVSSSGDYPMQQDDLSWSWGPSNFDITNKFVLSAAYQLPLNFMVSTIVHYRTGFPYTALDARDNNGDSYDRNERAMYQDSGGNWVLAGRNTYRQPANKRMDLRLSWTANFSSRLSLELILDVFNVSNESNWWTSRNTMIDDEGVLVDNFGELNNPGEPRNIQLGAKFRF